MTSRELALVVLKAMGIYFVVSALGSLTTVLVMYQWSGPAQGMPNPRVLAIGQAAYTVVLLGIGIFLLVNAELVLRLFFRETDPTGAAPVNSFAVQAIAFSVVGVFVLAYALPKAASWVAILIRLSRAPYERELGEHLARNWSGLVECIGEIGAGLWLFAGSRGLAALWRKLQPIRQAQVRRR